MPGIAEVFCAHFVEHAYPMHTHEFWTLLIVDNGGIGMNSAATAAIEGHSVTLLPPHVPHYGDSVHLGVRKRVLYLQPELYPGVAGRGTPTLRGATLRDRRARRIGYWAPRR